MFCRSLDIDERQGFLMSFVSNIFTLNNEKYRLFFFFSGKDDSRHTCNYS